ncbi:hypothetical protein UFOVP328_164 [uncultured Caudovirales phage]|uniref:Uncharacterized protein n=1 Tax=uncultured Caudovirales phage TaxID=2100421 RepID=A0A6J5LV17_9CAUD|nr:hypothetical protein UFOVP328_164 [uncultured Caudovirales phage]
MSYNTSAVYQKNGAVFADGAAAYADKNSLYTPELTTQVEECYATMLANGVLLAPVGHIWDQEAFTLTVQKTASSLEDYNAAVTFDNALVKSLSSQAGWTLVSTTFVQS